MSEFRERALELAGGKNARVLIIPHASSCPNRGQRAADIWKRAGAGETVILDLSDLSKAVSDVEAADLIWGVARNGV